MYMYERMHVHGIKLVSRQGKKIKTNKINYDELTNQ